MEMVMISSDSSSHQCHYHPFLILMNLLYQRHRRCWIKSLEHPDSVRNFFFVVAEGAVLIPEERRSTSPLHGADGLLGKLTENLEGEEESNITVAEDINA